jgi:hypothetical protein
MRVPHHANVLTSTLTAWRGTRVVTAAVQPARLLQLYGIEGSPYCRSVREVLTALGLDAEIYPCPQGGKRQFPLLVDPNTATKLYESAAIIDYLERQYAR